MIRRRDMVSRARLIVLGFAFALSAGLAHSAATGAPANPSVPAQPYFVSLKGDKVFMREGPSDDNRVKWIYHRKGLPVEVLASFEVWRRVRDMDGEVGWIHTALLSRDRMVVVVGKEDAPIRKGKDAGEAVLGEAQPGAIGKLVACKPEGCEVKFAAVTGWLDRTRLWGVHDGENF